MKPFGGWIRGAKAIRKTYDPKMVENNGDTTWRRSPRSEKKKYKSKALKRGLRGLKEMYGRKELPQ